MLDNCHLESPERWFQPITGENSGASLLCFPYAGSGAALFGGWRSLMFGGVELVAASLPGREGRLQEPPCENLDELVESLTESVASSRFCQQRLFLLGCSLGGLIAFELARSLHRRGIPVDYLIVAASRAPQTRRMGRIIHKLPDDKFIRAMQRRYAAIPPQIQTDEELKRLLVPPLRADMKMFETYQYREAPKLGCPILALGGTDDKTVPVQELFAWRHQTDAFRQRTFPGDHYFIKQSKASVLRTIERRLRPLIAEP